MRDLKFKVMAGNKLELAKCVYRDKDNDFIWWALGERGNWFTCTDPKQSTYLKDRKGIEIFEDDIVKYFDESLWIVKYVSSKAMHLGFNLNDLTMSIELNDYDFEVVNEIFSVNDF